MPVTIKVEDETLKRLDCFRNSAEESYDKIINRILNEVEEGELSEETVADISRGLKEVKEGKGQLLENVAKEFGIKL